MLTSSKLEDRSRLRSCDHRVEISGTGPGGNLNNWRARKKRNTVECCLNRLKFGQGHIIKNEQVTIAKIDLDAIDGLTRESEQGIETGKLEVLKSDSI